MFSSRQHSHFSRDIGRRFSFLFEWCVINIGVVICIACSGVHRSLGTHISKVRSLTLDDINLVTLKVLMGLGNEVINEIYEHTQVEDYPKPGPDASREVNPSHFYSVVVDKSLGSHYGTMMSKK